ncbi:MAG TPA: response regulator [Gemmatimonadales bacterium]|nr:response regulator [Gemmatimonadales bacterium]
MSSRDRLPLSLVADYLANLVVIAGRLEHQVALLADRPAEAAVEIRRVAHQLRGSGGAYGYPKVTQLAGDVEDATPEALAIATTRLVTLLRSQVLGHRVLVVDDDPTMAQVFAALVPDGEYNAEIAGTAAEADARIRSEHFDLVLLDLFLPDEDGRRLLARWRAAPDTATLPVFVLSAQLGIDVKTECFALGADAYFEKPIEPAMVAAAVASRLARDAPHNLTPLPARPGAVTVPAGPIASARVLLAEDDPLIADIVIHRLGQAGHQVTHVRDGAAAIAAIRAQRPQLLILDIRMPEMDGLQVLRQIRTELAAPRLPVIIVTALSDEEDIVRGFSLGADDYIVKPFSPAELTERVERRLRGQ